MYLYIDTNASSTIKGDPVLRADNTIVLKPSLYAPLGVVKVSEIIANEFPAGVINVVHRAAYVGVELTTNAQVVKIVPKCATDNAKHIIKAVSDTIEDRMLELGGNDAAIFLNSFIVSFIKLRYIIKNKQRIH